MEKVTEEESRQDWSTDCQERAKKVLRYLDESETLQVNLKRVREQLGPSEEADQYILQIARRARNERGKKLFQIFMSEDDEVHLACLARWDAQMKGLAMVQKLCQELTEETASE